MSDSRRRRRDRDVPAWSDEDPGNSRDQFRPTEFTAPSRGDPGRNPGWAGPGRDSDDRGRLEAGNPGRGGPAASVSGGPGDRRRPQPQQPEVIAPAGTPVAWRTANGWRVGDEEVSDLTSAMVLADLLAADLPPGGAGPSAPPGGPGGSAVAAGREELDARKLQETVAQLEHALSVRVRVEQAIGVLAERHRLRPRQAFELLRSAARVRGRRVLEVAGEVVDSATNPLLRIPEELAKPPVARRRGRMPRHSLGND